MSPATPLSSGRCFGDRPFGGPDADPARRPRRPSARGLAGVVLALLGLMLLGPPAFAHAQLVSVTPADGAQVRAPVDMVTLEFNEPVEAAGLTVLVVGPAGEVPAAGDLQALGVDVTLPVQTIELPGAYEVTWRIVSEDGHPLTGTTSFTVEAAAPTVEPTVEPTAAQATPSEPASVGETEPATPADDTTRQAPAVAAAANDSTGTTSGLPLLPLALGGGALLLAVVGVRALRHRPAS